MNTDMRRPDPAHTSGSGTDKVSFVPSPEQIAEVTMRRLRAEIEAQFGSVKAFMPELAGVIGYDSLASNLAGRSDMRLSVLYACLAALGMDQAEFARRVLMDLEDPRL
jgi:hypothetical protein